MSFARGQSQKISTAGLTALFGSGGGDDDDDDVDPFAFAPKASAAAAPAKVRPPASLSPLLAPA